MTTSPVASSTAHPVYADIVEPHHRHEAEPLADVGRAELEALTGYDLDGWAA